MNCLQFAHILDALVIPKAESITTVMQRCNGMKKIRQVGNKASI